MIENIWEHKFIGLVPDEKNIEKIILKKLHKLIESQNMRSTLSDRGRKTIDGLGCFRISDELKNILR